MNGNPAVGELPQQAPQAQPSEQQQQYQQNQRGNLSYFLFLSMLFFFMNGGTPDGSGELVYRKALKRLTVEREEFSEWLYPHTKDSNHTSGPDSNVGQEQPATTMPIEMPPSGPGNGEVPGADNDDSEGNGQAANEEVVKHDFVLQDPTPPPVLVDKVDMLLGGAESDMQRNYFHNVSGYFHGTWNTHSSLNISEPGSNYTEVQERQGRFPWNAKSKRRKEEHGKVVSMKLNEVARPLPRKKDHIEEDLAEVVLIRGELSLELQDMLLEDGSTALESRSVDLDLEGVHFLNNGTFYMHAAPPWKDLDMRQVPGLLLSNATRNSTARVVLKELDARLERIQRALATGRFGDTSIGNDGDTHLNCTFSLYGHLRPLSASIPASRVNEYERELHNPSGRSVLDLPPPIIDAVLFSKECDIVVELDEMKGIETDRFWERTNRYALVLGVLTALQTWVLVRQMEYTSTPTAISKVSHLTIVIQVILDVYFCVTHLTLGILSPDRASRALLVVGFFGILSGLLFGLRYAAIIRVTTYRPEANNAPAPAAPALAPAPPAPAAALVPQAASVDSTRRSTEIPNTTTPLLPRTTAVASAPPAERNSRDTIEVDQRIAAAYFIVLMVSLTLAFAFIGWFPMLMAAVYGYWIPQIYCNAERGTGRHALLKPYIFVTSAARLFIPVYMYACPSNLLFVETSGWIWLLVAYQAAQVGVLVLQDYFGPRFFLPKGWWFPEISSWDYHPLLPPDDIESSGSPGVEGGKGRKEVDCVICFEKIELASPGRTSIDMRTAEKGEQREGGAPPAAQQSNNVGDVFNGVRRGANRMTYMVPPCHHIAHTSCLESWAAIKMECPLCRRPLPPF